MNTINLFSFTSFIILSVIWILSLSITTKEVLNSNCFLFTICFIFSINNLINIMMLLHLMFTFYHKINIILPLSCNWIITFSCTPNNNFFLLSSFHSWIQWDCWWVKTSFVNINNQNFSFFLLRFKVFKKIILSSSNPTFNDLSDLTFDFLHEYFRTSVNHFLTS